MHTPSVLLYGRDRQLLKTREWILETVGIRSQAAGNFHEFESALASLPFTLIVICHSVSPADKDAAVAMAHRLRPHSRVLILVAALAVQPLNRSEPILDTREGPAKLVQAVRQMMADPGSSMQGELPDSSVPQHVEHLPVNPGD